jgi:Rhodopsin-like GPCR transmembrane domain
LTFDISVLKNKLNYVNAASSYVNVSGRVLEAVGFLIFLLMLLLMAKGFTITRGRISTSGAVKLALFMVIYCVVYGILFFYEADV